ncbi:MAG: hypothetical protein IID45_04660 [Planctomycetes bacterium]|nr:hypothetical protein [Planctomycetota bacterium]
MDLKTAQSISAKNATQEQIENAFADDQGRGEFIILATDDGSFIQAAGEMDGPYFLEYRDESSDKHFRSTKEVTKKQVKAAFLDYFRGGSTWRESFIWEEIESSKGCFAVFLLTLVIAIMIGGLTGIA